MADQDAADTVEHLAALLRRLRRREARERGGSELTYRQLAAQTGWSHAAIGQYLSGKTLPPADRLDILMQRFGAKPAEMRTLATMRDRVEEGRRNDPAGRATGPCELPPEVLGFTGRAAELAGIDRHIAVSRSARTAAIVVLSGSPGVGKTATAVHWAHRVAPQYPDGQLYVDLRGYAPDQPASPAAALAGLLRSLGVATADIPSGLAEQAVRYRSHLAGKRLLLILDNACTAEQVRPLLPGTASCSTVVTSRDSLSGLVARDGARRIGMGVLSAPEAVDLLRKLIGVRVDTDPEAAGVLAQRCARLPLALRVAAELAVAEPESALPSLLDEQASLDVLDAGGDPATAVRSVFSWSYHQLESETARTFRALGLHPGKLFDAHAVAALTHAEPDDIRLHLRRLRRAHLIDDARSGYHTMHDLLRTYAVELAAADPADEQVLALRDLFDYYLYTAAIAMDALFPLEEADRPKVAPPATPVPPVSTPEAARTWLDRERTNLLATAHRASTCDWSGHNLLLSKVLWRYFDAYCYFEDAPAIHASAVRTADSGTRADAEATANLGLARWRLGQQEEALDQLGRALALFLSAADREGEARVLGNIGIVLQNLGRHDEALEHHRRSLTLYRELGDRRHEGIGLNNIGIVHQSSGRYTDAAQHHQKAADIAVKLGDRRLESHALGALGVVCRELEHFSEATEHFSRALAISRETGDRHIESGTLLGLGETYTRQGRIGEAHTELDAALAIADELGEPLLRHEVHRALGDALLGSSQVASARFHYETALTLAREIGGQDGEAQSLRGLGQIAYDTGKPAEAGRYWQQAHSIFAKLDAAKAAELQHKLDHLRRL